MPDGHEHHLEPIIDNYSQYPEYSFFLPEIQSVLIEHSDFLKRLYEKEITADFLPYMTEYEERKGSPINPNVRIFFYDGSNFMDYYYGRLNNARCFNPFNLIFVNNIIWTNHTSNKMREMFSVFDSIVEEIGRNASASEVFDILPSEDLLAYFYISNEERNEMKEDIIKREKQRDAALSNEEKQARDHFLRKLLLFHELGHCDLQRDHEETVDSIMNNAIMDDIIHRVQYEYPYITFDNLLTNSLINELFFLRNTNYKPLGPFDSLLAKFGYGPASDKNRTKVILNVQEDITALRYYVMIANLVDE